MKNRRSPRARDGMLTLLFFLALAHTALATDDARALADKAFELRMTGQVDEAVAMLEKGLTAAPEAGVLHYELARAKLLLLDIAGMHEEALAAVKFSPDNNDFRYFAAMASTYGVIDAAHNSDQERMKELGKESLDQLQAILAADPGHLKARFMLVQLGGEMANQLGLEVGDLEGNVTLLEKQDPVFGAKARCCLLGEKEQGQLWRKILAEHEGDLRALNEGAAGLIQAGDLELAEKCLDQLLAEDKDRSYGLLGLGLAYFMKQEWERAAVLTQRYLDTDPPVALKAYATGRLAMIHQKQGDKERAKELRQAAREIDPHVWPTVMPPPEEIFEPI